MTQEIPTVSAPQETPLKRSHIIDKSFSGENVHPGDLKIVVEAFSSNEAPRQRIGKIFNIERIGPQTQKASAQRYGCPITGIIPENTAEESHIDYENYPEALDAVFGNEEEVPADFFQEGGLFARESVTALDDIFGEGADKQTALGADVTGMEDGLNEGFDALGIGQISPEVSRKIAELSEYGYSFQSQNKDADGNAAAFDITNVIFEKIAFMTDDTSRIAYIEKLIHMLKNLDDDNKNGRECIERAIENVIDSRMGVKSEEPQGIACLNIVKNEIISLASDITLYVIGKVPQDWIDCVSIISYSESAETIIDTVLYYLNRKADNHEAYSHNSEPIVDYTEAIKKMKEKKELQNVIYYAGEDLARQFYQEAA